MVVSIARRETFAPDVPKSAWHLYLRGVAEEEILELAGREVRITSPGKVLFNERGETKLDLVRYYAAVAEPLMRTMGGRPVLMQRFPQGASQRATWPLP